MPSILPLIPANTDFDDELAGLMGEAYDAACGDVADNRQPEVVREIIARRIIEAARKGERDPIRLRNAGLASLGIGQRTYT